MNYSYITIHNKKYIYAFYQEKLAYFGLEDHGLNDLRKDFPQSEFQCVKHLSPSFEKEIDAYFKGTLKEFKTPLYLSGTDFQKSVYDVLKEIPYGETVSYSDLAMKLGDVKKVRALANAVGKNRHLILMPCHRVIAKDGSLGGFSGGLDVKVLLHEIEGIKIKKTNR